MKKSLVSIIVPVYNVERYLEQCVKSILCQTYTDFEIILVDDCSPDGSPDMCDRLASEDSRIRVIHKKKNEGLGKARNTGLSEASGEYILFVDSDDYIEKELLERALSSFSEKTDVLVFGINRVHEDINGNITSVEKLIPERAESVSSRQTADIFAMLNKSRVFPFAWNKLYRKAFIDKNSAEFESTKLIEDFLFNIYLFSKAGSVKVIPDCLYNYRKPAHETLVNTYAPEFFQLCKRKYTLEKEFLKITHGQTRENLQLIYLSYVKHLVSVFLRNRAKKAGLSKSEQKEKISLALNDPLTAEVFAEYTPEGMLMKAVTLILRTRNPALCLLFISFVEKTGKFNV